MALETGTFISDLVPTNPVGSDPLAFADDHLRLLKGTIKNTFPNISGAVTKTHNEINTAVDQAGAALPRAGGTLTGPLVLAGAPSADLQASTKKYVDDVATAAAAAYPTKTGTGASGTWGINISGNAATATTATTAATATNATTAGTANALGFLLTGSNARALANYPVLTVSAADTYSTAIGDGGVSLTLSTSGTSYVAAVRYTIALYTGSIRFKAAHVSGVLNGEGGTTYNPGYLAIYKNGSLIQEYVNGNNNGNAITRTNDVSVVPGDVIEWRIRALNGGFETNISSTTATASNAYTTRPLYIAQV